MWFSETTYILELSVFGVSFLFGWSFSPLLQQYLPEAFDPGSNGWKLEDLGFSYMLFFFIKETLLLKWSVPEKGYYYKSWAPC